MNNRAEDKMIETNLRHRDAAIAAGHAVAYNFIF